MFRSEADLRAFADRAFSAYAQHHPQPSAAPLHTEGDEKGLTPEGYYYTYLVVFGVAPSEDEVELVFLRRRQAANAVDGDAHTFARQAKGPNSAMGRPTAAVESSSGVGGGGSSGDRGVAAPAEERVAEAMARLRQRTVRNATPSFGRGGSVEGGGVQGGYDGWAQLLTRSEFLFRVCEKYALLHGPFRSSYQAPYARTHPFEAGGSPSGGDGGGGAASAALWALFDSIAVGHRGYFTYEDVVDAVRRFKAATSMPVGVRGPVGYPHSNAPSSPFPPSSPPSEPQLPPLSREESVYLSSVFALCDVGGDGRVTLDQFRSILGAT